MKHCIEIVTDRLTCVNDYGMERKEKHCCGECDFYYSCTPDSECVDWECPYERTILTHSAFDCSAYEFDELDGFKSRGRCYDIDDIVSLRIDGKQIYIRDNEDDAFNV